MLTCLLATLLSIGQVSTTAGQTRFTDIRLVIGKHGQLTHRSAGFDELGGALILDTAARQIRFEADGRTLFAAPFDSLIALHYEDSAYPKRSFRRPTEFLTIHYATGDGQRMSRVLRLTGGKTPDILAALKRQTGLENRPDPPCANLPPHDRHRRP